MKTSACSLVVALVFAACLQAEESHGRPKPKPDPTPNVRIKKPADPKPPEPKPQPTAKDPIGRRGAPIEVKKGTNQGTKIGDRWYTGHALDQMQGRGATPSVVENTIAKGTRSPGNLPNTTRYSTPEADVVTNKGGGVITVIVKGSKGGK